MNTTMCAPMPADTAIARPWRAAMFAGFAVAAVAHVATAASVRSNPAATFATKRSARHLGSFPT